MATALHDHTFDQQLRDGMLQALDRLVALTADKAVHPRESRLAAAAVLRFAAQRPPEPLPTAPAYNTLDVDSAYWDRDSNAPRGHSLKECFGLEPAADAEPTPVIEPIQPSASPTPEPTPTAAPQPPPSSAPQPSRTHPAHSRRALTTVTAAALALTCFLFFEISNLKSEIPAPSTITATSQPQPNHFEISNLRFEISGLQPAPATSVPRPYTPSMPTRLANFINNQDAPPQSAAYLANINPATGELITEVPDSGPSDVSAAVAAARSAFPAWSATPAAQRSAILLKIADLIDANLDELARAESIDTGKPISLARTVDIPRCASNFRFFATAILHSGSDFFETDAPPPSQSVGGRAGASTRALNYTLRRPRGVAGLISPWNLPLYLLTWKIAPALATGNTAVCKPSEITPTTASMLARLAAQAGLPPGVLNIVHGTGPSAGAALVEHDHVPAISFTGSTAVGQWIAERAGRKLKRLSLELGGKNPFIIFDDAATAETIDTAARAAFTNQGQICLCGARLLVHRKVFDHVLAGIVDRAKSLKIGDPLDPQTQQGALVSRAHMEKVDRLVQQAKQLGGKIHCGGSTVAAADLPARCKSGFFYHPTVISGLDPACAPEQDEIFGPVVTLQPFDSEDEAIKLANGTRYGLAATLFTNDLSRAHRLADKLDAGIVWVNCWMLRDLRTPFGGTKHSGVGREGGNEALRFFTEPKNICIRI